MMPHSPKYWKVSGKIGDNNLKNTANIGIESVKITDVFIGYARLSVSPKGKLQILLRKKHHPK
jgi:hypothetical protein